MKSLVYRTLGAAGADKIMRLMNRKKILILAYHGVTDAPMDPLPGTMVRLDEFKKQMLFLKKHYQIRPLDTVLDEVIAGKDPGVNTACITFDDGYRNVYDVAFPVLRDCGFHSTVFLPSDLIGADDLLPADDLYIVLYCLRRSGDYSLDLLEMGAVNTSQKKALTRYYREAVEKLKRRSSSDQVDILRKLKDRFGVEDWDEYRDLSEHCRLMNWSEIIKAGRSGLMDFGAHTRRHEILTNLQDVEAGCEIMESKKEIERRTGAAVTVFAYPNGKRTDFNGRHSAMVQQAGYKASLTTLRGLFGMKDDIQRIPRLCIGPEFRSISKFACVLSRNKAEQGQAMK